MIRENYRMKQQGRWKMLSTKEVIDFWAKKLGLDQDKNKKKRMNLRAAKKAQRQDKHIRRKDIGHKAVKNQRDKRRQLRQIAQGE